MLRPPFVLRPLRFAIFATSACLSLFAMERHAFAFERQWHLGGGVGGVYANGFSIGPALNAYAAYGLSDVFDARLEASVSRNQHDPFVSYDAASPRLRLLEADASLLYGAKLAVAYKVDVIEWIPYAGPSVGFLGVAAPEGRYSSISPTVGAIAGMDYAFSRDIGFGLAGLYDFALIGRANVISAFLRAEYHFGY